MRVLEIIESPSFGGIEKYILDISNNIKGIDIDFLTSINVHDGWNNLNISRKTIRGRILYNHRLYKYLKNNRYDIVHINSGVFLYTFQVVMISKLAKVKKVIVHSHAVPDISKFKKIIIKILKRIYLKRIDKCLACSDNAAKALFFKEYTIINNGIEINNYKFNNSIRNKYRKELNINDKKVYGHIGDFTKVKNYDFLLNVFNKISKKEDNSVLLLIGEGPLKTEVENKIKELNLSDKVLLLGYRKDANNIFNAMDIFLFPSFKEGLGLVVIEALTNGLPVIASNEIPDEACISNNVIRVPLEENKWIDKIKKIKNIDRKNAYENTIEKGYDIKTSANEIKRIYKEI